MEVPRHSNRVGVDHPRTAHHQWPRVGQQSRQLVQHGPPTNRPTSARAKSSGLRPFQDPSVKAAVKERLRLSKLETAFFFFETALLKDLAENSKEATTVRYEH